MGIHFFEKRDEEKYVLKCFFFIFNILLQLATLASIICNLSLLAFSRKFLSITFHSFK